MTSDEKSIRALIERWHGATAAGDIESVLALMSDDVEFLVPGKEPMKGRSAFEAGLRRLLETHRIRSSGVVQEVQVSDGLAFAVTLLTVRVAPLGASEENVRSGYSLSVFRRQREGDWLLVRDANLLPPS